MATIVIESRNRVAYDSHSQYTVGNTGEAIDMHPDRLTGLPVLAGALAFAAISGHAAPT